MCLNLLRDQILLRLEFNMYPKCRDQGDVSLESRGVLNKGNVETNSGLNRGSLRYDFACVVVCNYKVIIL